MLALAAVAVGCATGANTPFDDQFGPQTSSAGDGGTGAITSASATVDPSVSSGLPPETTTDDMDSSDGGPMTATSAGDGCVPATEVCNGLDDDCNGEIDEADPEEGGDCDTGESGVCAMGILQCQGEAGLVCVTTEVPAAETCNGLDDDCNGMVDDGNPGGGAACQTGMPGICAAGTQTCTGGAVACVADQMAAASEVCGNGLDDDCNGTADDTCGLTCQDADLGNPPTSANGSTAGQGDSFASSCGGGADYLFRFVAPAASNYTFDTIGSGYDTLLTVYSDCNGTELACNDDFAGNPDCGGYPCSEVTVALAAGQNVIVAVEGFSGATGAFTLNVN